MKETMRKPLKNVAKGIIGIADTNANHWTPWGWFEPKVPKKLLEKQQKDA